MEPLRHHEGKEPGHVQRDAVRPAGAQSPTRRSSRPPASVLIADDTTDSRELYAEYFRHRGFTVITADDGARAVQTALEHVPDVIVMDLAMPQFDGITAIERIKADPRMGRTRVILLTGYPFAVERRALEAGADLFLRKPCLPERLVRHVNALRRRTSPGRDTLST
jgi:CheY-like chemotaxis protein